ncbi:hypothetical protein N0V88_005301 [Collariella sp. IMI 366227]|nr:hypothetical protein N0V88_005301 [Collariella sp. IMI 366227]
MSSISNGTQSSQPQLIPLNDFLSADEDHRFVWGDEGRETSDDWLVPVWEAKLDPRKHKVFKHGSKEYIQAPSPFIQLAELGESGSTIVYKVMPPEECGYRWPLALKVITCKEYSRPPGPDSFARSNALKEVKMMSGLRHPHIVAYVASFEDHCLQNREIKRRPNGKALASSAVKVNQRIKKHILGIAMYPPAMCNLRTFMEEVFTNSTERKWILQQLHGYFGCLAQAVAYLHGHKPRVKHKDIKPENIVIDDFGTPILTDFGLSKNFETGEYSEGPTPKTIKYAAPEAVLEAERDQHSDIFSLGCVFLEIATVLLDKPPSFAESQLSIRPHHNHNPFSPAASARAILSILPYIRRMMHPNPALRPDASQLYPWFRHLYEPQSQLLSQSQAQSQQGDDGEDGDL